MAQRNNISYSRPARYLRCEDGVWYSFGPMPFYEAVLLAVRKYRPTYESCVVGDDISLIGIDAILAVRQRPDFPVAMKSIGPREKEGGVG